MAFLSTINIIGSGMTAQHTRLDVISEKFGIRFVLSISKDDVDLPEVVKARIIEAL